MSETEMFNRLAASIEGGMKRNTIYTFTFKDMETQIWMNGRTKYITHRQAEFINININQTVEEWRESHA